MVRCFSKWVDLLVVAVGLLFFGQTADAADRRWVNSHGGSFHSSANWSGGVPGANDVAIFGTSEGLTTNAYSVSVTTLTTNQGLTVEDDNVSLNLNGVFYRTPNASNRIGFAAGKTGQLTVRDGVWQSLGASTTFVGFSNVSSGVLTFSTGAQFFGGIIQIDSGALVIQNGATAGITTAEIGPNTLAGFSGTATVTGMNSKLTSEILHIGLSSTGTLAISAGGRVENSGQANVGHFSNGDGEVNIDGANSLWKNSGFVELGRDGQGALNITGGGRAEIFSASIGAGATTGAGFGTATVSGVSSQLLADNLFVGFNGDGTLNITSGGLVKNAALQLEIAHFARGEVNISSGGQLESVSGIVGGVTGVGIVSVSGAGSKWTNSSDLNVSNFSQGTLSITDGGVVQNVAGVVGAGAAAVTPGAGAVLVDGLHSRWINTGNLNVGHARDGALAITNRGSVSSVGGSIGTQSISGTRAVGVVTVDGPGSEWLLSQSLVVGESGDGTLNITAGGLVDGLNATVGANAGSTGAVLVDGVGSLWFNSFEVFVGTAGSGTVTVTNGGTIRASTVRVDPFGILRGNGTILGNVLNFGIVAPGASIGTLQVDGDFSQRPTGVLEIEIGGTSGSNVDLLNVGAATLDGELRLKLIAGTIPAVNVALTATSLSGQFDNVANGQRLGTVDGLGSFVVNYGAGSAFDPMQIVLSSFLASVGVPGDYNNNGVVDAADYVLWRNGAPLANEVDTPGVVNSADYTAWRARFGKTSGSGASFGSTSAVPEPSVFLLLATIACWIGTRRRIGVQ